MIHPRPYQHRRLVHDSLSLPSRRYSDRRPTPATRPATHTTYTSGAQPHTPTGARTARIALRADGSQIVDLPGGAQDREEPGLEGVLEHGCGSGRSDSRPLRASGPGARGWRASGGEAWAGAKRNAQSQPALARLLLRNALSGWGLPGHPLRQKGKPPRGVLRGGQRLSGWVIRYQTKPTHACGRVRRVWVASPH